MHIVPSFKAAVIQFEPILLDKPTNMSRLMGFIEEAGRQGARLAVLPELATTGYCFRSREDVAPLVEPIPGPTTDAIAEVASRFHMHVVVSLPEVEPATGVYYNAAALVGPAGVIGKYRKVHSFYDETVWAKDGDLGFPVFETPLGRLAIIVCMDADFFESARIPALKGADVICFPTAWVSRAPSRSWRARALENGVYFLAADRWGTERGISFGGGSCIISPLGEVLSSLDRGDGVVIHEVNVRGSRDKYVERVGDLMDMRAPDEYHAVLRNSHLWPVSMASRLPGGRRSRLRVFQFDPKPGGNGENLAAMAELLEASQAESGCDIAVYPELCVSGIPEPGGAGPRSAAESIPGPATERLALLAAEFDTHIVAGMIERDGEGRLYNSAVLLEPGGVVGVYRKIHLNEYDSVWATRGDLGMPCFDVPAGRVGMAIGSELLVPEVARCLAKNGVDIILAPSVWPWREWDFVLSDRAANNDCYLALANQGAGGEGRSLIYGNPSARESAHVDGDRGWATLETSTDPDSFCRRKEMLRKVQPVWYDAIVRKRV
ncbi:MAG: nitrilase-related carbon-nitrogen hydrolase [Ignavibacteriales bacterium]